MIDAYERIDGVLADSQGDLTVTRAYRSLTLEAS